MRPTNWELSRVWSHVIEFKELELCLIETNKWY